MTVAAPPDRLLAFLVQAVKARRLAALAPEPGAAVALAGAAGRAGGQLVRLDRAEDLAPATDLLYLGSGAPLPALPPGVLVLAADPAGRRWPADAVTVLLPVAPTPAAPRIALAMAGPAPTPAVLDTLAALHRDHRQQAPTDPVDEAVGRLLYLLARARRAQKVLEIGTSTGAAALWLASALVATGGHLTTLERDSARATTARRHFRQAGLADRIDLRRGEAARLIPRLMGPFDLLFLDEAPEDRPDHLRALSPRLAAAAFVVAHGSAEPAAAAALGRYQALVRTLPAVADGLTLTLGAGLELTLWR
jgi:predicted O-methyltransferase YrrM